MLSKNSNVIIAAILASFCVISLAYITSCSKPGKGPSCDGIVCQNGSYCAVDTVINGVKFKPAVVHCNCPSGFEGPTCGTPSANKFFGTWDVTQTVIGSDSANTLHTDSVYQVILKPTPTPTTFMILNLCGDRYYDDVVCVIDSNNTSYFMIDTLSAFHMVFDHYKLTAIGTGIIADNDSQITARLCIRHINYNANWQNDTLGIVMKRRSYDY